MNTMIEEIRKRIKARMDNTDAAGDYDEYADGQGVGLAAALRIIDEVEKEHPIPSDVQAAAENSEIIFSTDGELTIYSFVGAPRWWATIREAEEALSVFKAGAQYERERMMKKGDDELEKMIDDFEDWDGSYSRADLPTSYTTRDKARFFANWQRERLMKEAVECEIGWSDGYRIAPVNEKSMNEALAKIGVLDQVGAGVDAKVSVIIIKKEK